MGHAKSRLKSTAANPDFGSCADDDASYARYLAARRALPRGPSLANDPSAPSSPELLLLDLLLREATSFDCAAPPWHEPMRQMQMQAQAETARRRAQANQDGARANAHLTQASEASANPDVAAANAASSASDSSSIAAYSTTDGAAALAIMQAAVAHVAARSAAGAVLSHSAPLLAGGSSSLPDVRPLDDDPDTQLAPVPSATSVSSASSVCSASTAAIAPPSASTAAAAAACSPAASSSVCAATACPSSSSSSSSSSPCVYSPLPHAHLVNGYYLHNGSCPLLCKAVVGCSPRFVRRLLQAGCDPNLRLQQSLDLPDVSSLERAWRFHRSANDPWHLSLGDWWGVSIYADRLRGGSLIPDLKLRDEGFSPLMLATIYARDETVLEMCELLLAAGADVHAATPSLEWNVGMLCLARASLPTARALYELVLSQGFDPDRRNFYGHDAREVALQFQGAARGAALVDEAHQHRQQLDVRIQQELGDKHAMAQVCVDIIRQYAGFDTRSKTTKP